MNLCVAQIYLPEDFQQQEFSCRRESRILQLMILIIFIFTSRFSIRKETEINQKLTRNQKYQLILSKKMNLRQLQNGMGGLSSQGLSFHGTPLIAAWLPIVTLAVLVASLRWHKYSFYAHVFLALIVIGLTLGATINVMVDYGLDYGTDGSTLQTMHNTSGLIVTIWLGLQIITGVLARVIQYSPKVGTNFCIWTKRFHMISSYMIMILAKFSYLNIQFIGNKVNGSFFILLAIDILILIIYLLIKFKYWTISEEIIDNQLIDTQRQPIQNKLFEFVQSVKESISHLLRELNQSSFQSSPRIDVPVHYKSESQIQVQNYVIFNDFVYATDSFKQRHPGGQHIMRIMNKRQVDRFMYGSFGPELETNVKAHTHTQDSMRLCGMPIGKIDRVSPMKGFNTLNKCQVIQSQRVIEGSDTFLIHLRPESTPLRYDGYQLQKQIGHYFSVTITNQKGGNRCTRLFTNIWCMRPDNIDFMEKNFPLSTYFESQYSDKDSEMDFQASNTVNIIKNQQRDQFSRRKLSPLKKCIIPVIAKKYKNGQFSSHLCVEDFRGEIILSEPMGVGMKYDKIPSTGNVIFVTGGTGLQPFSDFVDLLFKRVLVLESSYLSDILIKRDPLVGQDLIKDRSFVFYCAIQKLLQLPALTLYQLNHLCKSKKVRLKSVMRIKKGKDLIISKYPNIQLQQGYFNDNVLTHIKQGNISQFYLCGSPQMDASIGKIMAKNGVNEDLYRYI